MVSSRRAILTGLGLILACLSARAQTKDSSVVIRGGTLIDGTGAAPHPSNIILIKNGKIEAVGEDVKIPSDIKQIDAAGKFIIPALIDSRVRIGPTPGNHVMRSEVSADQRLESLRALLAAGVSTARLIQGDLPEQQVYQRWAEDDVLVSPRIVTSGPVFTAKGGHPIEEYSILAGTARDRELRQIASEDQAREKAREVAHAGAGSFEINADEGPPSSRKARLQKPILEILISEAHGHDLPAFCEVGRNQEVLDAIAARANAVEGAWEELFTEDVVAAMASGKVAFVPSLTQQGDLLNLLEEQNLKAYLDEPIVQQSLSSTMKESLANNEGMIQRVRDGLNGPGGTAIRQQLEEQQKRAFANVQKAQAAGVKIALGTGAGNLLVFPGASAHRELQLLVKAGLTPMEAIVAATRNTADSLGRGNEMGTIEPGKDGDLLILDANPLLDIQNTQKIHAIVQNGREVRLQDLQLR
jgi:imidazolonepropionase-like amidohydrolase